MSAVASSTPPSVSHWKNLMNTVYPLDDALNCALIIFSIGLYIATAKRASHATSIFTKAVAGLSVVKTVFTIMKCTDGLQKIARGETFKEPLMKAVASVAFTIARIALCLFALEKVGILKLGHHTKWLNPIVNAAFGGGTILYLMNAINKRYFHEKPLSKAEKEEVEQDVKSGLLNAAGTTFELEVLSSDAPLALKISAALFAALAAAYDAKNGLCPKATPVIPPPPAGAGVAATPLMPLSTQCSSLAPHSDATL